MTGSARPRTSCGSISLGSNPTGIIAAPNAESDLAGSRPSDIIVRTKLAPYSGWVAALPEHFYAPGTGAKKRRPERRCPGRAKSRLVWIPLRESFADQRLEGPPEPFEVRGVDRLGFDLGVVGVDVQDTPDRLFEQPGSLC